MASTHRPFAFLQLPPELRNRIYEYAMAEYDIMRRCIDLTDIAVNEPNDASYDSKCRHWKPTKSQQYTRRDFKRLAWQPDLTRVCKEVRSETLPMFYGQNVWLVQLRGREDAASSATLEWLDAIGSANRRLLKIYVVGNGVYLQGLLDSFAADKVSLFSLKVEGCIAADLALAQHEVYEAGETRICLKLEFRSW